MLAPGQLFGASVQRTSAVGEGYTTAKLRSEPWAT
jgi:hypothetical protein